VSDAILLLNAGSSSIKFSLFEGHVRPSRDGLVCDGEFDGIGHRVHFLAKDQSGKMPPKRSPCTRGKRKLTIEPNRDR
jgi:acetate kinase